MRGFTLNRVEIGPQGGNIFVYKANSGNISSVSAYLGQIARANEKLSDRVDGDADERDIARWSELEKIIAANTLLDSYASGKEKPTEKGLELLKGRFRPYLLKKNVGFRKVFCNADVKKIDSLVSAQL